MKSTIGFALLLGVLSSTACAGAGAANRFPVEYQAPASWKLMKHNAPTVEGESATYEVPEGVDAADHPVVLLKTYKQPAGLRMENIDIAGAAKQVIPSGVPVSCAHDGPNWETCVFLGRVDDAKILALYRIGIQDGYVAEEVFIFPMPTNKSEELALLTIHGQADQEGRTTGVYTPLQSTYKTISLFNEFTKTLSINGEAPFNAKAIMGKPSEKPTAIYRWSSSPLSASSGGS